jgi:hypothetical protein
MKKGGCFDCKHHKKEIDFWSGNSQRTCLVGNNKEVNEWWDNNSKKTIEDDKDLMDCFEPTESSVLLGGISSLLDKLSEVIDKK